jgi:BMFP domain-containing protein YqiC
MQTDNKLFDDLSKLATSAVGTIAGMGREAETMMRERFERFIGGLDLIKRDEFEAVKDMAAAARAEADALAARVAALEAQLAAPKAKAAPKKSTGKSA